MTNGWKIMLLTWSGILCTSLAAWSAMNYPCDKHSTIKSLEWWMLPERVPVGTTTKA